MLNQKDLGKLIKGDEINHFLLVKRIELKTGKRNNPYLSLELGDHTSSISANLWDNYEGFYSSATLGCVVKVVGIIDEYLGQQQLRIKEIRCSDASDNITAAEFMPKSRRNPEVMKRELAGIIARVKNPFIVKLLQQVFSGKLLELFSRAPAGKSWHHSYLYGLLEHTLELVKICELMSDIHPEVNRDLLICGALVHDLGKVDELTFENVFDYSDKGRLLGHIVMAALDLNEKMNSIPSFPEGLKNQILHLVLSHQGKLEFASPVIPKTLESIILYQADELSAKSNAYKSAISAEANGTTKWTKYIPLISTSLFITDDFGNTKKEDQNLFD